MSEKIFDAHVHVYPDAIADRARVALGKFYNFEVPGKGTYDGYIEECRENQTSGFLVFSVATTAHQVKSINDYIADRVTAARAEGFEAVGFAAMTLKIEKSAHKTRKAQVLEFGALQGGTYMLQAFVGLGITVILFLFTHMFPPFL